MGKVLFGSHAGVKTSGSDDLLAKSEVYAESVQRGIRTATLFMEAEVGAEEIPGMVQGEATNAEEAAAAAEVLPETPMTVETADVIQVENELEATTETPAIEAGTEELHEAADKLMEEIHTELVDAIEAPLSGDAVVASGEAEVDASSETEVAADVDNTGSGTAGETVQTGEDAAAVGDIKVEVNL